MSTRLRLVHSATREEMQRDRLLESLSSRPYTSGPTWRHVLDRRESMLRYYHPPNVPEEDADGKMSRLKEDVWEAICATSLLSRDLFPHKDVETGLARIGISNAVEDLPLSDEGVALARKNRDDAYRALAEALLRAAYPRSHRERAEGWLHERGRPSPNDADLTWLAVAEINLYRIGGALPLVLVLPNFHHPFNPYFVRPEEGISVSADVAAGIRLLFER